jgi:hypothetical protein
MEIKIQIDPEKEPELYELVCHASRILGEVMGPRAARFVTEVQWSQLPDFGPLGVPTHVIRLKMTDPLSGIVEEWFQLVELRSPGFMKTRLLEVWRKFLRQLSDERMDSLDAVADALEGD